MAAQLAVSRYARVHLPAVLDRVVVCRCRAEHRLVVPAVSSLLVMVNRNPPVPLSCEAAVYCPRRLMQAAAAAHLQVGVGTREAWHFFMLVLDCLELEVQSLCKADLVQCR